MFNLGGLAVLLGLFCSVITIAQVINEFVISKSARIVPVSKEEQMNIQLLLPHGNKEELQLVATPKFLNSGERPGVVQTIFASVHAKDPVSKSLRRWCFVAKDISKNESQGPAVPDSGFKVITLEGDNAHGATYIFSPSDGEECAGMSGKVSGTIFETDPSMPAYESIGTASLTWNEITTGALKYQKNDSGEWAWREVSLDDKSTKASREVYIYIYARVGTAGTSAVEQFYGCSMRVDAMMVERIRYTNFEWVNAKCSPLLQSQESGRQS